MRERIAQALDLVRSIRDTGHEDRIAELCGAAEKHLQHVLTVLPHGPLMISSATGGSRDD